MKFEFEESKLWYLGGLIDSDGNIDFFKRKRKNGYTLFPKVTVASIHYAFLKKVNDIFDNIFYLYKTNGSNVWTLEINSVKCFDLLHTLANYLIFKKHKADFINNFSSSDRFSCEEVENIRKDFLSLREDFSTKEDINTDWFSGLIDGDGCFLSYKNNRGNSVKNTLAITYHEKYNDYFNEIISIYGGQVRDTHNRQWYKNLAQEDLPLLRELVNKLILKKSQAMMLYYWISGKIKHSREYPFEPEDLISTMHEAKDDILPAFVYQKLATRTAMFMGEMEKNSELDENSRSMLRLSYISLGLSEISEIQGKVKKILRDKGGIYTEEDKVEIKKEISDAMWYIALLCEELDLRLDEVLKENLKKLYSRMERGKIHGSGDNR